LQRNRIDFALNFSRVHAIIVASGYAWPFDLLSFPDVRAGTQIVEMMIGEGNYYAVDQRQ
jgi:predicted methyltransferase